MLQCDFVSVCVRELVRVRTHDRVCWSSLCACVLVRVGACVKAFVSVHLLVGACAHVRSCTSVREFLRAPA